jgi:hypothetical protein
MQWGNEGPKSTDFNIILSLYQNFDSFVSLNVVEQSASAKVVTCSEISFKFLYPDKT